MVAEGNNLVYWLVCKKVRQMLRLKTGRETMKVNRNDCSKIYSAITIWMAYLLTVIASFKSRSSRMYLEK